MKTLEASVAAIDWRDDEQYREAIGRLSALRKTGHLIATKIEELKQSIEQGAEETIGLRADELVSGRGKKSEALSSALDRLANDREELANLETELKALGIAEKRLQSAVGPAERSAKLKVLDTIMEVYADKVRALKAAVDTVVQLNTEVLEIHQVTRSQDLEGIASDKTYLKILRMGGHLEILSDVPNGYVAKWNAHVAGLIS
jgi:phosphopantetheine adenylyltransferase